MLDPSIKPSSIVKYLDQYVIGQDEAKKIMAVAVYAHYKKLARSQQDHTRITKSNELLIGSSGTGKTLLKAADVQPQSNSGESVQHALLKIMEGTGVKLGNRQYIDTTNILFICGGAFVGLDEIMSQTHGYGFVSMSKEDNQKILDRLNSRVKPTEMFTF